VLPKKNRLKKKKDFENVFKHGKSFKSEFLTLRFKQGELENSRFGFIVSNKVSKKAVVRNRTRRRLQSAAEKYFLQIEKNIDGIFMAFPGLENKSFLEIQETVGGLFLKAGLISK
jgi:ribonuclease P protein component